MTSASRRVRRHAARKAPHLADLTELLRGLELEATVTAMSPLHGVRNSLNELRSKLDRQRAHDPEADLSDIEDQVAHAEAQIRAFANRLDRHLINSLTPSP